MEGLLPMVYKAIKRKQTRRQYRCLSNGASQSYELIYDHVDGSRHAVDNHDRTMEKRGGFEGDRNGHRRFGSMGDYEMRSGYHLGYGDYEPNSNGVGRFSSPHMQLKRYRSHRMFSCITGGA